MFRWCCGTGHVIAARSLLPSLIDLLEPWALGWRAYVKGASFEA